MSFNRAARDDQKDQVTPRPRRTTPTPADLSPLETIFNAANGPALPLPDELAARYGALRFPSAAGRAHVIANFVSTLDGVVALNAPGEVPGADVSGGCPHDRFVMGLLRAVADAVIVGAGTLRPLPRHRWTAEAIYPPFAAAFGELRTRLGKPRHPLNVVVTASGELDQNRPVFRTPDLPALIVTTERGARSPSLRSAEVPVAVAGRGARLTAAEILAAVRRFTPVGLVLTEGGPHLLGAFLAEHLLDELFLTFAPQIAGRAAVERPGLVSGRSFAPVDPRWAKLVEVKRAESHLFLRYALTNAAAV